MKNKIFKLVIFSLVFLCFAIIYPNNINVAEKKYWFYVY